MGICCIRENVPLLLARYFRWLYLGYDLPQWPDTMVSDCWRSDAEIVHPVEGGTLLRHAMVVRQDCPGFHASQHLIQASGSDHRLHARHRAGCID